MIYSVNYITQNTKELCTESDYNGSKEVCILIPPSTILEKMN